MLKFVTDESADREDLVGEIARDVRELAQQRKNPLADFKPAAPWPEGDPRTS